MKKLFLLLTAVLMAVVCALAQTKVITGTVVSAADDEPLAGATVHPVGGGQGTATDIDGNFSLTVPTKVNELTVSYVGMVSRKVPVSSSKMLIKLEDSETSLDEVMVVAYGTAKKSAFTGSATVISNEAIEKTQVTNVLDALSGKVAGLQLSNASGAPGGSSPTIRIRGFSSLNAGNSPLVIVDGTPYTGDINTLNTNDIESMTVLKDAASNALYGARGANGVILITTKRAKLGEAKVTVDAKWGSNSRAQQDYNYITDPAQYYETYYSSLYNFASAPIENGTDAHGNPINIGGLGYSPTQANAWANSNMINSDAYGLGYNVYTVPNGQMLIGKDGRLNPYATLGRLVNHKGASYYLYPDNWMDATYKNSMRQEYNVSIAQGNEKNNFYASVGYLKNDGIVIAKSDYERFSARLSADVQAKPWLKVSGNVSYSHFSTNSMSSEGESGLSSNIFAAATTIAPIYPLYIRDGAGNIMVDQFGNTRYDYGSGDNAGLNRPVLSDSNAVSSALLDKDSSEGNTFTGTGSVEIRFLRDFKFTANNNINLMEVRATSTTNPYYGQYAASNGIVSKQHARNIDYTFQQLLTWTRTFNNVHNVTALLGHEYYKTTEYVLFASKNNMFDPNNDELATAITEGNSNSYRSEYNNEGWLFRGQYDYDGKYFGSVSYRRDASSRFHPDHRWGNFWSLGGAWIISKEKFMEDITWIDMLKVKASYGEQGNDNIGNYLYTNTYTIKNSNGNPAAVPASMGNEYISWEKNGNFNAGVEYSMFNGRFSGNIEAFYRKTSDMLMFFPLPPSFGYNGYYDNIGNMSNVGLEIELNGTPVRTRDFTWNVNFNLTWYKNRISYLPEQRKGMTVYKSTENGLGDSYQGYSSSNYFYGEGLPMYTFFTKKYAGVDPKTGKSLYYQSVLDEKGNETGEIQTTTDYANASYYIAGSALAPVYGGFSTQFQYRDFDLSVAFNYQLGGKVYDSGYASLMGNPTATGAKGSNIHADMLNAWTPENPNTDVPRLYFGDQYANASSDRFITDASYLSIENINFGYTLPAKITRKAFIDKVRVYLACDNVWVWSKRQGLDPRQSFTGGNNNTYYAPIRTISGGLTVTF